MRLFGVPLNYEFIKVCVLHEGILESRQRCYVHKVGGNGLWQYGLIITQINSKTTHVILQ